MTLKVIACIQFSLEKIPNPEAIAQDTSITEKLRLQIQSQDMPQSMQAVPILKLQEQDLGFTQRQILHFCKSEVRCYR